jgi:hypothetical protein
MTAGQSWLGLFPAATADSQDGIDWTGATVVREPVLQDSAQMRTKQKRSSDAAAGSVSVALLSSASLPLPCRVIRHADNDSRLKLQSCAEFRSTRPPARPDHPYEALPGPGSSSSAVLITLFI